MAQSKINNKRLRIFLFVGILACFYLMIFRIFKVHYYSKINDDRNDPSFAPPNDNRVLARKTTTTTTTTNTATSAASSTASSTTTSTPRPTSTSAKKKNNSIIIIQPNNKDEPPPSAASLALPITTTIDDATTTTTTNKMATAMTPTATFPSTTITTTTTTKTLDLQKSVSDVLCSGCRHATFPSGRFCGTRIDEVLRNSTAANINDNAISTEVLLIQAAIQISKIYPDICFRCNPNSCTDEEGKLYWRYDDAAPKINIATTHYLSSIPQDYRLSSSSTKNINNINDNNNNNNNNNNNIDIAEYLSKPEHVYPQKLHLFEYNPSIALLPKPIILTDNNNNNNNDIGSKQSTTTTTTTTKAAVYMASYRVSHIQACFDTDTRKVLFAGNWETYQNKTIPNTDYLGIALLDENLQIVRDTVVTFRDKSNHGNDNHEMIDPRLRHFRKPSSFTDYRLFRIHDTIYLSMGIGIVPIAVSLNERILSTSNNNGGEDSHWKEPEHPVIFPPSDLSSSFTKNKNTSDHNNNDNDNNPKLVKLNTALKDEKTSLDGLNVYIRNYASCPIHGGKLELSKNLQYLVDTNNHTKVENNRKGNPHDIRDADLTMICGKQKKVTEFLDDNTDKNVTDTTPPPSFGNTDELKYPFLKRGQNLFLMDRGSACCVNIPHPIKMADQSNNHTNTMLLLGISHPKTVFPGKKLPDGVIPNSYLSRFYAFEPYPPYRIVARSGKFCFGYPQNEQDGENGKDNHHHHHHHPLWDLTARKETYMPLKFADEVLNCPRIHFVSGITEKAGGDGSSVIVSYGVNDCLSRFVEISKSEIAKMLWRDGNVGLIAKPKVSSSPPSIKKTDPAPPLPPQQQAQQQAQQQQQQESSSKAEQTPSQQADKLNTTTKTTSTADPAHNNTTMTLVVTPTGTKPPSTTQTGTALSSATPAQRSTRILEDPICHGCRHNTFGFSKFCGEAIAKLEKTSSITLVEAAKATARNYSWACFRCDPDVCDGTGKYLRFDDAAPPIVSASTHYLPSVPSDHRFPQTGLTSIHDYISNTDNTYPNKLHMFEYNPSIVTIPDSYRDHFASITNKVPAYLASYRVTHINLCLETQARMKLYHSWDTYKSIPHTDHLGLAILADDLSILSDTVVTWKNKKGKKHGDFKNWPVNPSMVDYRIFRIHDTIYLTMGIMIFPIIIVPAGHKPESKNKNDDHEYVQLRTIFPGGLDVYARDYASCFILQSEMNKKSPKNSKNLQYFVDGNNDTVVDFYPNSNPHDVRHADLTVPCGMQNVTIPTKPKVGKISEDDEVSLIPSFGTIEEVEYPSLGRGQNIFTGDRGSACCVTITHNNSQYFLGVSHPKTVFPGNKLPKGVIPNTYLSRFFAFERLPPYQIVARTGKFCFGYAGADAAHHPIGNLTKWPETKDALYFAKKEYDCPRIHFVTGITDKAGDPSKIVLAYGVHDCLSRFIEIDKKDIAAMLWPA